MSYETDPVDSIDNEWGDDALELNPKQRQRRQDRQRYDRLHRPKRTENELRADLGLAPTTMEVSDTGFNPSFHGSRHERAWILSGLGPFYDNNLITDVIRPVKGGKEASVYCCAASPSLGIPYLAGKVYRPRMFRQLRNDKVYREGRLILDADGKLVKDEGAIRAIAHGTAIGKDMLHTSWLTHEYDALLVLHQAGALVPKPYARDANAILMEYLGDADTPAPLLTDVALDRREAKRLYDALIHSVELMLANNRVHGDLSAYNVLYWQGEVRIIDFPQTVDAQRNAHARRIFERDIARLCGYFADQGLDVDARRLARDLWRKHVIAPTQAERQIEDQLLHMDETEER